MLHVAVFELTAVFILLQNASCVFLHDVCHVGGSRCKSGSACGECHTRPHTRPHTHMPTHTHTHAHTHTHKRVVGLSLEVQVYCLYISKQINKLESAPIIHVHVQVSGDICSGPDALIRNFTAALPANDGEQAFILLCTNLQISQYISVTKY